MAGYFMGNFKHPGSNIKPGTVNAFDKYPAYFMPAC